MIILKKDIPSDYGLEGKEGEVKTFGANMENMLIAHGIAEAYIEPKPKKEKTV